MDEFEHVGGYGYFVNIKQSNITKQFNFGIELDYIIKLRHDVYNLFQAVEYKYKLYNIKSQDSPTPENIIIFKYLSDIYYKFKGKYIMALNTQHEIESLKILKYELTAEHQKALFNNM